MRRLTSLVLTLAVLATAATACTASNLDSSADVTVTGTVLDPEGKPLAGARIVLVKEVDFGEAVFGLTFVAATLGVACLADAAPAICSKARRVTTGADGTYSFQLKGRDTQGTVGTAATFHLSTRAAPDDDRSPSVSARFQIQETELEVPQLRIWAPKLELALGRTVRATWAQRDPTATERILFYNDSNTAGADVIWSAEGRSPLTMDTRFLEDSKGAAIVESDANQDSGDTRFRLTYQSARVDYSSPSNTPPSRSQPCSPDPCAVTDGDLGPPSNAPPARNEVTVDLTRSSNPTLVVVRGCPGQCDVETSVDGLSWRVVGSASDPFFTITPVLGTPVRFVKLKSVSDVSRVAEISVWVAQPQP